MAFQQALSGLSASSKALDVIGNNVANSATVGFKSAQAHFSDVFANSLSGAGASQVGIGVAVAAVQQQFTQGNVTTTNNPLDIAINGGGFFRMNTNGAISYTRNGQFHLDKSGNIINDQGAKLTGYGVDANGKIVASSPTDIHISSAALAPVATGQSGSTSAGVLANINLDSRSKAPTGTFNKDDASTYNFSTPVTVYDSLGNAHTQTLYAVYTPPSPATVPPTGVWTIHASLDGAAATSLGTLTFDSSGKLMGTGVLGVNANLTNGANPLAFNINFTGSTQFGSTSVTNSLEQDGYTSGSLTGIGVGADGIIRGNYSNGQARTLGQVVLANFADPNGLSSLGNNQWAETSASGAALVGAPNSGRFGVLQASSVEESNVDLTAELVNMITAQRNYQANAQTIKTQDAIMQTLVNLR
jgi:flagellar hook protein FlgE